MAAENDKGSSLMDVVDLIEAAESFVKDKFQNHDPSHDWHHVHRVRLMAVNLARCASIQSSQPNLLVIELAALFHDLCDAKYLDTSAKANVTAQKVLGDFFEEPLRGKLITPDQIETIYRIIDSVSWSKEEARRDRMQRAENAQQPASRSDLDQKAWEDACAEFKCVSDADRLDAIGSIGIMRVSAYSAVKGRPLHIPPANAQNDPLPPAEQAQGYNDSAVAHFHSKLLRIRGDRLKTDMARAEAERRQALMASFLSELELEWLVADQGAKLSLLQ